MRLNKKDECKNLISDFLKEGWIFGFILLKYEYDRRFYMNFGKVKAKWYTLMKDIMEGDLLLANILNLLSIEFGLNIIGVNDWRKKEKNK